ncbi:hypothetical protein CL618_00315 [archaeon]|nr:hypothetical protein [archaeon]
MSKKDFFPDILLYVTVVTAVAAIVITGSRESKETANQLENKVDQTINTEVQHENENHIYPSQKQEKHITLY